MIEKGNTKAFYKDRIPNDWNIRDFGNTFSFLKTFSFSREQLTDQSTVNEIYNIHYGDIHATFENEILDFETECVPFVKDGIISEDTINDDDFPLLKDGDLIIADASEDYVGVAESVELKNLDGKKVVSGLHTFAARDIEGYTSTRFRTYTLRHPQVIREVRRVATGFSVFGISKTNIAKIKLPLPPLPEQKEIARLLSTWNEAITKMQALITKKEQHKKWLMQNLLTGKKRINKSVKTEKTHKTSLGELPVDWKLTFLKNIMDPVKKSFIPDQCKLYRQIGIRSHTKGLFYKEKVTGASLGDKSVFCIEPNCFIVNIVFAWEHAIAKTTEKEIGMIASHRFPMFKPKEKLLDLDFLLYYFKSLRGKHLLALASPGGAGRNKTLGQSEFLKLQIPIPSLPEQIAIANLLQSADTELQLLKNKMEKLKEQKKGLMQVLLTGKKRLKINKI
jgi:type I restriction enzyme, S subunit